MVTLQSHAQKWQDESQEKQRANKKLDGKLDGFYKIIGWQRGAA